MTGIVAVELPEPSEYPADGQPQWNAYPFVRIRGYEIELGTRSQDIYAINSAEARAVAAALLAAAVKLDAMNHC